MINDIIIETPLDQPSTLSIDLSWVDEKVLGYIKDSDLDAATNMVLDMKRAAQLSGMSLAISLYYLEKYWERFETDTNFFDELMVRTGFHRNTITTYTKVGKLLREEAPEGVREQLSNLRVNQLIPIANAVAQGYEIGNETWQELVATEDEAAVREIIRDDVKESDPRESSLRLWVTRDGTIFAYKGKKSQQKYVGSLEVESDDPDVQKAVERIIKNAGMLRD